MKEDRNWKSYALELENRVEKLIEFINNEELLEQHINNLKKNKLKNDEE